MRWTTAHAPALQAVRDVLDTDAHPPPTLSSPYRLQLVEAHDALTASRPHLGRDHLRHYASVNRCISPVAVPSTGTVPRPVGVQAVQILDGDPLVLWTPAYLHPESP